MTRRCTTGAGLLFQMLLALSFRTSASASRRIIAHNRPDCSTVLAFASPRPRPSPPAKMYSTADANDGQTTMTPSDAQTPTTEDAAQNGADDDRYVPPWSLPALKNPSAKAYARFRQHVNPLSRRYQMPADLPADWPNSDFDDASLPLYLDVGCGKGGFLLELVGRRLGARVGGGNADGGADHKAGDGPGGDAQLEPKDIRGVRNDRYMNITKSEFSDTTSDWLPPRMNYLGLEIRPGVSQYARARAAKRGLGGSLSFVGCNANVDLGRMLELYRSAGGGGGDGGEGGTDGDKNRPAFVSIQFPDPHFKKSHAKRRVVTPALVRTLAEHMAEGGVVFLQSDVREALEAMRDRFVEGDGAAYFAERNGGGGAANVDAGEDDGPREYGMENPLGIPTEREVSVLEKGLPVYRTLFERNGVRFAS